MCTFVRAQQMQPLTFVVNQHAALDEVVVHERVAQRIDKLGVFYMQLRHECCCTMKHPEINASVIVTNTQTAASSALVIRNCVLWAVKAVGDDTYGPHANVLRHTLQAGLLVVLAVSSSSSSEHMSDLQQLLVSPVVHHKHRVQQHANSSLGGVAPLVVFEVEMVAQGPNGRV